MEVINRKTLKLSLIHYPLTTLGPDTRIGIWFQGCSIRCSGCMSVHTWDIEEGFEFTVKDLIQTILSFNCKYITISGGEPFEQPHSLHILLKELKKYKFEILIYSGYKYNFLLKQFSYILEYIDILIDGNFNKNKISDFSYKGSDNQQIIIFSQNKNIVNKYNKWSKILQENIQIIISGKQIMCLGIIQYNTKGIINGNL